MLCNSGKGNEPKFIQIGSKVMELQLFGENIACMAKEWFALPHASQGWLNTRLIYFLVSIIIVEP
jgi:hypothetical protein